MSVTIDILRSYRHPRAVLRARLDAPPREDLALVFLLLACVLFFVAQWPQLARAAHLDPAIPLDARLGGALFGWLFIAPLGFYALAALSHVVARALGGQGSWYGARLALFWALLVVAPPALLQGLVAGFIGPGPALDLVGMITLAWFLLVWGSGLVVAERKTETKHV